MAGMSIAAIGLLLLSRAPVGRHLPRRRAAGHPRDVRRPRAHVRPADADRHDRRGHADAGLASGLFNSSQQIGGALGLAILSTVAASQTTDALDSAGANPSQSEQASALVDGFQAAFAIGAGLMLVGVILAALLIRRRDVAIVETTESVHAGI